MCVCERVCEDRPVIILDMNMFVDKRSFRRHVEPTRVSEDITNPKGTPLL